MSVNIGISANPSQVVTAFDAVRDAIRRAGQEGRAFRDLDLSHPELQGFAQDLGRMQRQLEDLTRVSVGATASSARKVFGVAPGGANPLDWNAHEADWARMYPDEAERRRLQSRVQGFVTQGTMFAPAPPAPPPMPAPPPPATPAPRGPDYSNEAEDAAKGLPPIMRSVARAAVQGATFGLSMAGIGGIRSAISNSYHSSVEEGASADNLFRRMPELAQSFDTLRESVRRASDGMGITYNEAQRMAGIFVRTRGDPRSPDNMDGESNVAGWTRLAAGFGRSTGIDSNTSASMFARASANQDLSGEKFAMMVGDAAARGFQTGNVERVMEGLLRYTETTSRVLVGSGGNVEGFAGMWAAMNATGKQGLRGDNATALIGSIDNAVRQGGLGGHASEAVTWRAFAAAGVKDPYEMQYLQEGGMFQKVGKGTLFDAVSGEINKEYRGAPRMQRLAAFSRHFGISMHQAEALEGMKPENVRGTQSMLEGYGIDPSKVMPDSLVDLAKLNASGDWEGGRKRLLGRSDLSADERRGLEGASGNMLQEFVVRTMAAHGMTRTVSSDHTDATVNLANRMTEFGDMIVPPMTALKNGIVDLTNVIRTMAAMGGNTFGPGAMPFLGGDAPAGSPAGVVTSVAFRSPNWRVRADAGGGDGGVGGISHGTNSATKAAFIAKWGPEAQRIAARAGTSAENILAHWGQETGWGTHEHDNNVGNLQALRAGPGTVTRGDTHADGSIYQAPFQAYRTPAEAADAYLSWIERHGAVGPGANDSALAFGGRLRSQHYMENPHAPEDIAQARRGLSIPSPPGGGPAPLQAPAPGGGGGSPMSISFDPLRVVHEDRNGNERSQEYLPIRAIGAPVPYGTDGPYMVEARRNPLSRQLQSVPVSPTLPRDI